MSKASRFSSDDIWKNNVEKIVRLDQIHGQERWHTHQILTSIELGIVYVDVRVCGIAVVPRLQQQLPRGEPAVGQNGI